MCVEVLANTWKGEWGSEKIFPGWCSPPGWGAETCHTFPPLSFVLCTFRYDSTFLCKIALCYILFSNQNRNGKYKAHHYVRKSGSGGVLGPFWVPGLCPPSVLCAFWPHFAPWPVSPLRVRAHFGQFWGVQIRLGRVSPPY